MKDPLLAMLPSAGFTKYAEAAQFGFAGAKFDESQFGISQGFTETMIGAV
jgi:hypothetical protein